MEMKKAVSGLLLAACFISLNACGRAPAAQVPQEEETPQTIQQEITEPQEPQEPEVLVMTDATDPVDYSTVVFTWMHYQEGEGDTLRSFNRIDNCQYGTAGSSLQQASAAVDVLLLTQAEDVQTVLADYLDAMNTTQRDFFSFQWQMSAKKAKAMLADPDGWKGLISDSGRGDVELGSFQPEQVDALSGNVLALLAEKGVTHVWKDHTDQEPFAHWTEF